MSPACGGRRWTEKRGQPQSRHKVWFQRPKKCGAKHSAVWRNEHSPHKQLFALRSLPIPSPRKLSPTLALAAFTTSFEIFSFHFFTQISLLPQSVQKIAVFVFHLFVKVLNTFGVFRFYVVVLLLISMSFNNTMRPVLHLLFFFSRNQLQST